MQRIRLLSFASRGRFVSGRMSSFPGVTPRSTNIFTPNLNYQSIRSRSTITEKVSEVYNKAKQAVGAVLDTEPGKTAQNAAESVKETVKGAEQTVGNMYTGATQTASRLVNGEDTELGKTAQNAAKTVKDTVKGAGQAVGNIVSGAAQSASRLVNGEDTVPKEWQNNPNFTHSNFDKNTSSFSNKNDTTTSGNYPPTGTYSTSSGSGSTFGSSTTSGASTTPGSSSPFTSTSGTGSAFGSTSANTKDLGISHIGGNFGAKGVDNKGDTSFSSNKQGAASPEAQLRSDSNYGSSFPQYGANQSNATTDSTIQSYSGATETSQRNPSPFNSTNVNAKSSSTSDSDKMGYDKYTSTSKDQGTGKFGPTDKGYQQGTSTYTSATTGKLGNDNDFSKNQINDPIHETSTKGADTSNPSGRNTHISDMDYKASKGATTDGMNIGSYTTEGGNTSTTSNSSGSTTYNQGTKIPNSTNASDTSSSSKSKPPGSAFYTNAKPGDSSTKNINKNPSSSFSSSTNTTTSSKKSSDFGVGPVPGETMFDKTTSINEKVSVDPADTISKSYSKPAGADTTSAKFTSEQNKDNEKSKDPSKAYKYTTEKQDKNTKGAKDAANQASKNQHVHIEKK